MDDLSALVSIPKWCDYRDVKNIDLQFSDEFQFQNGAIIGFNCKF